MSAASRSEPRPKRTYDADVPKPRDTKSQGIVRDERGQEQPADKERAQQTSKTE
jgi:hypothetical protein